MLYNTWRYTDAASRQVVTMQQSAFHHNCNARCAHDLDHWLQVLLCHSGSAFCDWPDTSRWAYAGMINFCLLDICTGPNYWWSRFLHGDHQSVPPYRVMSTPPITNCWVTWTYAVYRAFDICTRGTVLPIISMSMMITVWLRYGVLIFVLVQYWSQWRYIGANSVNMPFVITKSGSPFVKYMSLAITIYRSPTRSWPAKSHVGKDHRWSNGLLMCTKCMILSSSAGSLVKSSGNPTLYLAVLQWSLVVAPTLSYVKSQGWDLRTTFGLKPASMAWCAAGTGVQALMYLYTTLQCIELLS